MMVWIIPSSSTAWQPNRMQSSGMPRASLGYRPGASRVLAVDRRATVAYSNGAEIWRSLYISKKMGYLRSTRASPCPKAAWTKGSSAAGIQPERKGGIVEERFRLFSETRGEASSQTTARRLASAAS